MGQGVLVVFSAPQYLRNNDVEHEYRQSSDFFYLTGLDEPSSALVLTAGESPNYTLFVRPRDKERETWDGPRLGLEGAKAQLGADQVFDIAELSKRLPELLLGYETLYFQLGEFEVNDQCLIRALNMARRQGRRGRRVPVRLIDASELVHEMRRIKSDDELEMMRRACRVTRDAHLEAMKVAAPGKHEYEVEAALRKAFLERGSVRVAYAPIVASGPNATILHYVKNDRLMQEGELLLIDAGCEHSYYASDVTRTFPISGRFSDPQRRIYDIVLEAQRASIEAVRPGATFNDIHAASLRIITEGLIDLGFIDGPLEIALSEEKYKPFFMHKTSHYLGMDVHDVGRYFAGEKPRALDPGVVLTVEPGIYIARDNHDVPTEYRGIGVRIEDDILVTASGYENLTLDIPKDPAELESFAAAGP